MASADQILLQYLSEALTGEQALIPVLEAQLSIAPPGPLREDLRLHVADTKDHEARLIERLGDLGHPITPLAGALDRAGSAIGQAVAKRRSPIDVIRGTTDAERVLRNARDGAATEALEVATYMAIETLARETGDETTAKMAASIRSQEERMLTRLLAAVPELTETVAAEAKEADAAAAAAAEEAAARQAASANEAGSPSRLATRAVRDAARRTVERARKLAAVDDAAVAEPWPGYDTATVPQIKTRLKGADAAVRSQVHAYESARKARVGVLSTSGA